MDDIPGCHLQEYQLHKLVLSFLLAFVQLQLDYHGLISQPLLQKKISSSYATNFQKLKQKIKPSFNSLYFFYWMSKKKNNNNNITGD
mmetsp:Transcript_1390/g.1892  ORF Transcript_1390/g.1892 Transcript_1390/m.1892 type:complete len:87 (-) Transcript_1390:16-276(-)